MSRFRWWRDAVSAIDIAILVVFALAGLVVGIVDRIRGKA